MDCQTPTAFTETSTSLAALSGSTPPYVSELAKKGLIPFITAANGMKLFSRDSADAVRRLKQEGLARRGRHVRIR